jgi:hypothetical protein
MSLSAAEWAEIRGKWEAGESPTEITRQYGIKRPRIYERAKKENWPRPETVDVRQSVEEHLSNIAGSDTRVERVKAVADAADELSYMVQGHRQAWRDVKAILMESIKVALDRNYKPPGWTPPIDQHGNEVDFDLPQRMAYSKALAQLYKTLTEGMLTAQEGERRAHGIDFRMQIKNPAEEQGSERRAELIHGIRQALAKIHAPQQQ